jgi:hypothetical protein
MMKKECFNCLHSFDPDWLREEGEVVACDTCENHNKWQELKDNEK